MEMNASANNAKASDPIDDFISMRILAADGIAMDGWMREPELSR